MRNDEEPVTKPASIAALEARLRALPEAQVPEGLEADILRAIPVRSPAERQPPVLMWAASVLILVTAAIGSFIVIDRQQPFPKDNQVQTVRDTSAAHIVLISPETSQETDPCNILPPFAARS